MNLGLGSERIRLFQSFIVPMFQCSLIEISETIMQRSWNTETIKICKTEENS